MKLGLTMLTLAACLLPTAAQASTAGDQLAQRLYDGTLAQARSETIMLCEQSNTDACFAAGLTELIAGVEGLSQAMYRHGATLPSTPMAMLFGMDTMADISVLANPKPEPLSYAQLRTILDDFVVSLDAARGYFELADMGTEYVIAIDPMRVRIDLDGDGTAGEEETLAALMASADPFGYMAVPKEFPAEGKTKSKPADTTVGFDNADALWFAGYTQVVAAPVDLLLAHDFSQFFDAYLHRVFPQAGLPMQEHSSGGMLFMDPDSDTMIADLIAGIHTADFPVTDPPRLAGVLTRLKAITALSRWNWDLILAETDDNRELVPSPKQTSLVDGLVVTDETVAAWRATLDTMDKILGGTLLVPHWRFKEGFDLTSYFETATETDLVMLIAGQGALPFIKPGPVADAQSFAEANRVFGAEWLNYVFWFN